MTENVWFVLDVIGAAYAVLLVVGAWLNSSPTRKIVFRNLDDAYNMGYFYDGMNVRETAEYLVCHGASCQGFTARELEPYVFEWMIGHE